ncbi:M14 family zinc carboxypeptidase [Streptomyces sp. NPDC049040]|uniref:M14 family zinc carboxypeptidase n=1 Tax=Streptomyces sp. NPDC049040 TaxID=3365593 RepID=UPI003722E77E
MIDASSGAGRAVMADDRYPTVGELTETARLLAARHPEVCRVDTVGSSRAGQPLTLLSVGHAADDVLIVAGPHPDEFVGGATAMELAHRVLADPALRESTRWNFLLCLDPDGAGLANSGHGVRSMPEFFEHFFRPASEEQPEWAPSTGVTLPESRILLGLIASLRPFLQCSLHGTDVGGTFVQVTRDLPELAEPFRRSAAGLGIPIESGSYDTFSWPESGPGIFTMPPAAGGRRADGNSGPRGTTWLAPHGYGGATAIVEVPIWASDRLGDRSPVHDPREQLIAFAEQMRSRRRRIAALLDDALPHLPSHDSPFLRSLRTQLAALRQLPEEWDPRVAEARLIGAGRMTRAKLAGMEVWAHRLPVRAVALLRRALEPAGRAAAPVKAGIDEALHDWCAGYQQRFRPAWVHVARQAEHQANTVQAAVALSHPARGAGPRAARVRRRLSRDG